MKRLSILLLVLFTAVFSFAQPTPYPINQNLGNANTLLNTNNGGLKANHILLSFADTASANSVAHVSFNDGALIRVGDSIFLRSAGQWVLQTNTISPVLNTQNLLLMTGGYTLVDSTLTILAKIVWLFNGVPYNQPSNQVFTINTLPSGYKRSDVIWIDSFQVFRKTVGVADTTTAVLPQIPYNGITVAIADINGSTITANVVSSFQKKAFVYTNPVTGQLTTDSLNAGYDATTRNSNFGGNITIPVGKTFNIGDASNSFGYDGTNFVNLKSYVGNFRLYNSYGNNVLMQLYYNNGSTNKGFINLNSFGFGTTSPDTSAVLDVASTTRGMLIPRMTTTQRNAISGATKSLLIYNNTIDSFQYYNAGWHTIGAGGGSSGQDTLFVLTPLKVNSTNDTLYMNQVSDVDSGWVSPDQKAYWDDGGNSWGLEGSAGTDPTINFLGTTDAQPLYLRVNNDTIAKFGTNTDNISMGADCHATGATSFAVGTNNIASGDNSTAIGYGNISSGFLSTTIGGSASATGESSIAIGTNSTATGDFSVAIGGGNNNTNGASSFAIGNNNVSTGTNSLSIGNSLESKSINSIVLGKYNDYSGQSDDDTLVILQVGNGYNNFSRSNAMTILQNGNVGIGTTTPAAKLQIASTDSNVLKLSGLINTALATDSSLVIGTDGNVKKAARSSGGGVTSVSGTTNRITSTGGTTPVIDISASYVGQSSITTLGTVATGTWNATTIDTAKTNAVSNINVDSPLVKLAQGKGYLITADTGRANTQLATGWDLAKVRDSLPTYGTYTPTFTNKVNIDSIRAENWKWTRIGNEVTITGYVVMDGTASASTTTFTCTLPINPTSNFSNIWDLKGLGQADDNAAARGLIFKANVGTSLAAGAFSVNSTAPRSYYFTTTYSIQ